MIFRQKDIILVRYPFSDFSNYKVRPAIIISNEIYNLHENDILLVAITSVLKEEKYSIFLDKSDLVDGELITKSRIKTDKIFSIDKKIILKKIGIVIDNKFKEILKKINEIIN